MKKLSLILLLLSSACVGIDGMVCNEPTEYDRNTAQSYYESFGVYRARLSDLEIKKLFGCNFHYTTDYIYYYDSFWGRKYILVRYNKAVTYADGEKTPPQSPFFNSSPQPVNQQNQRNQILW